MADDNQNINENILNETLKHLKEEHEKFELQNTIISNELRDLQKAFCSVYGVIRVLDFMLQFLPDEVSLEFINQVHLLRAYSSDVFERQILKIEEEE